MPSRFCRAALSSYPHRTLSDGVQAEPRDTVQPERNKQGRGADMLRGSVLPLIHGGPLDWRP